MLAGMPFELRSATVADIGAVVTAYHWLFAPPGAMPAGWDDGAAAATVRDLLHDDRFCALLAADGADVVGLCTVYLDIRSVRYGQRAWVEDLAVDPGRRSAGVGKALLDAAKDWARGRGATHLELDSAFARTDAHRFYEREQPSWDARSFGWVLG
jgi:GNAT superfamily N-acetyltransferase